MKKVSKPRAKKLTAIAADKPRLYTLEVFILSGMITKQFAKKNRRIGRTIQIRGDQTLADLHDAIFDAFDRFDEHLYEFQFGKKMHEGPRYRREMPSGIGFDEDDDVGVAEETTLDSLGLKVGRAFGYWFDFGDDWWHQVDVAAIDTEFPKAKYPKVIKRVGESPPQYLDLDEDGE